MTDRASVKGVAEPAPDDSRAEQPAAEPPAGRAPSGGKKKIRRGVAVPELLEAAGSAGEPGQETRFQVFVIDTGWNETAHKVLRKQIPLFDTLTGNTPNVLAQPRHFGGASAQAPGTHRTRPDRLRA